MFTRDVRALGLRLQQPIARSGFPARGARFHTRHQQARAGKALLGPRPQSDCFRESAAAHLALARAELVGRAGDSPSSAAGGCRQESGQA